MKKVVEKYLIKARLEEIEYALGTIEDTSRVAEFAQTTPAWLALEQKKITALTKEQKILKENLNV